MKLKLIAISILIVMLGLVGCSASDPISDPVYISDLHAPTGRTATYVIAAYDSPIGAKAQADYVMPLATSDLGIVVTTAFTDGYNSVKLLEGNYQSTTTINIPSASYLTGSGMFTTKITLKADVPLIKFQDDTVAMGISDMTLDGDSNAYSATSHAITATGTVLSSNRCWIKQVEIDNFTGSAINLYNIQDCVFENIYIQGCGSVASTVYSITLGGTNAIGTVCNRFMNVTIHAAPYGYIYLNDYARDNVFINTKIDHLAITTALHGIYISGMINRFEGGISLTYLIPVFQISGANGKHNIIRDWYGEERKSPTAWGSSGVYMTQNIAAYNKVVDSVWTGFQRPLQTDNQCDEFIGNTVLNTGDVDLLLDTNSTNCVVTGNNFVSGKGLNIIGTGNKIYDNVGWITQNSGKATVSNTTTSIVVNHGLATTPTRVIITPRESPTNAVSFWWVDTLTAIQFTINVNADPGASNLDFDWRAVIGEGN
jgi:hypothetical protein